MSSLEYSLNSLAWALGGVVVTLTYQRIANWYRKRNNKGELPPISTTTYFGSLLVMISIIATLFSYSGKVAADDNKNCQTRVNENNVIVLNRLIDSVYGTHGFVKNIDTLKAQELLALENKRSLKQVIIDFNKFFGSQNDLLDSLKNHKLYPISSCDTSNLPPSQNLLTPTTSSPSPSPTK